MSSHSSLNNSLNNSKKSRRNLGGGSCYDIVAIKTKSSEITPYEGDGKSLESLNLREDMRAKHEIHWKGCPNYSSLYGEGAQLNHDVLNPKSTMSDDGSSISHGGISYQRTGSGKYRASNGASLPGSALGAIFKDEGEIRFGGIAYERTGSGNFIAKDGRTLDGGAMAAIFGGFASSGELGGFDNYNADGTVKMVAPPLPFGRFAAIDSVVAEGQHRMAHHKKSQIIFGDDQNESRPSKAPSKKPSAYSTEYQRSFSGEERMTSADRIKSGEVYKVVVDNLRQNLEAIKNYEQDPAEALRQHFQAYAAFGKDRHKDGSHITLSQIDRWFKQAQVIDGDNITTTDTAIVFKKISGSCAWITYREYLKFLDAFAEDFQMDIDVLKKKLGTAGPPCPGNATEADNVPVVKRLTNPSKFPGTHNNTGQAIAAM